MNLTPEAIVGGLGILLAVWYLFASIYNRRRGIAIYNWLRAGLETLGGKVSGRWLGSSGSGAELRIQDANPPFKALDIIYLLASRELLPLFLVNLLRGKRDRLIVKMTLRFNPRGEMEAVPARSGLARQMRSRHDRPWRIEDGPHGLVTGARGGGDVLRIASMPLLEKYGDRVIQLSWAEKSPHLIATLSLAGLYEKGGSAAGLYADLAAAATAASQSRAS